MYAVLAGLFLLCLSVADVKADDIKAKLKGKWEVTASGAPDGYRNYTIDVKEKDADCFADIKGGSLDLKDQKLTEKDGKVTFTVFVEEYVKVTVWEEKGAVLGTAESSSIGKLPLTFKKK